MDVLLWQVRQSLGLCEDVPALRDLGVHHRILLRNVRLTQGFAN